jgi:type IV secretion system protein VirB9
MIILPPTQQLQEVICGDSDYWIVSAADNIAHIKPAKQGASTNLNLVTTTGDVYSFFLTESQSSPLDLKVYVNREGVTVTPPRARPSETEVAELQASLTSALASRAAAERRADEAVAVFRQQYPARMQFTYRVPKYQKPFLIRAVWHDGQFTYLKTDARELPALYELKDGRPALVNFTVQHGLYVVPKIIERGYLALGKKRLPIDQER